MQLYALDCDSNLVTAPNAVKHQDYHCLECASSVRVRGGIQRRIHFYHKESSFTCRLNGKSEIHLELQYYFFNELPQGDCFLEKRFSSIKRIADVVWLSKKIIFEIQCSPIAAEEVKQRTLDYASLGYQVIWILHEKQFNNMRLSAAEAFLIGLPHYFTNMNIYGQGIIYDQISITSQAKRLIKSPPQTVDIKIISALPHEINLLSFPGFLRTIMTRRLKQQTFYFQGDFLDLAIKNVLDSPTWMQEWEENYFYKKILPKKTLWNELKRFYLMLFRLFLERIG